MFDWPKYKTMLSLLTLLGDYVNKSPLLSKPVQLLLALCKRTGCQERHTSPSGEFGLITYGGLEAKWFCLGKWFEVSGLYEVAKMLNGAFCEVT